MVARGHETLDYQRYFPSMKTFRLHQVLKAAVATGYGTPELVENFDHVSLAVAGSNSAGGTLKIQASLQDAMPDFTAAASPTNLWTYIQVRDLITDSAVDGGTGVVFSGDGVKHLEVNTFGVRWINVQVSAYSAGQFDAWVKGFAIDEAA